MAERLVPPDPAASHRRLLVYADDLGMPGRHEAYRAYGTLWLPWERRGDLLKHLRALRDDAGYDGGILAALHRPEAETFALGLIDEVFRRRWLSFRALVTRTPRAGPEDVAAASQLVARRLRALPGGLEARELRLRLRRRTNRDEGDARQASAELERALAATVPLPASLARSIKAARTAEAPELAQFLAALIADDWEKRPGGGSLHRRRLSARAAENLGWTDLAGDTRADEWKFNIAYVDDLRAEEPTPTPQRAVQLRLPLVD